ncbi:MAG: 2-carboxy-1,4-naphthoquinone phytyltransferase [Cyanobacteria bacterium K_DeepCast_35m_m2_155]|nr:2-carboxy-1,4-naphthoquinone phytyltransferase [Cyanobacteria bacterium K_DeepCast_35m_m2_155]
MPEPQVVASRYASERRQLWKAAIKWPMYAVAVMPVLLAAGWTFGRSGQLRVGPLLGFLSAAVLLLAWENLSNDVFDHDTGIDAAGKPHSVVQLTGRRSRVAGWANGALLLGLLLMALVAWSSTPLVLALVLACCGVGYAYQGPPLRLGYHGLGEPLCWLAFGPLATAAALLALDPALGGVPWGPALELGSGPALATTLVLFCSHFHQVADDAAHGKRSPVVRLGTARAAALVPWFVALSLALQVLPVLLGIWPLTALLGLIGVPPAVALSRLLERHHATPERIAGSKFLALRFQSLSGLGLALGLALGRGVWAG